MHGVRALALERRLAETNTIQRIRRLQGLGVFDKAHRRAARRRLQLPARPAPRARAWRRCGCTSRWTISSGPDDVSKLERDLLKDSLQIVKQLKEVVRHHFHLAMF